MPVVAVEAGQLLVCVTLELAPELAAGPQPQLAAHKTQVRDLVKAAVQLALMQARVERIARGEKPRVPALDLVEIL